MSEVDEILDELCVAAGPIRIVRVMKVRADIQRLRAELAEQQSLHRIWVANAKESAMATAHAERIRDEAIARAEKAEAELAAAKHEHDLSVIALERVKMKMVGAWDTTEGIVDAVGRMRDELEEARDDLAALQRAADVHASGLRAELAEVRALFREALGFAGLPYLDPEDASRVNELRALAEKMRTP